MCAHHAALCAQSVLQGRDGTTDVHLQHKTRPMYQHKLSLATYDTMHRTGRRTIMSALLQSEAQR